MKKIKDLTLEEALSIHHTHQTCEDCPLNVEWRSSDYCIFDIFNMGMFFGTKKLEKKIEVPAIKIKPSIFAETENLREEEIEPVGNTEQLEEEK